MPALPFEYRFKLQRLFTIVVAWQIVAVLTTLYERTVSASAVMQRGSVSFDFSTALGFNMAAALMGALMGGSFLVFYVNVRFRDRPYAWTVIAVAASFVLVVAVITALLGAFVALGAGRSFADPQVQAAFVAFVTDPLHAKNIILWGPVVMLTQFTLQISDKFGPRVLWHFLWGRYNVPREEERIFMFADLKSSTTIALRLDNERYHRFLRDYFADLTDPIQYNRGEIYQYVGDEIVVSWNASDGLAGSACLNCFFQMRAAIALKAPKYVERYGAVPAFKAGMHIGHVIAGEFGIIKRDITYSGDVLNTTSRIQGVCNTYEVDLLCSDNLVRRLPPDGRHRVTSRGLVELKGKGMKTGVNSVTLRD